MLFFRYFSKKNLEAKKPSKYVLKEPRVFDKLATIKTVILSKPANTKLTTKASEASG